MAQRRRQTTMLLPMRVWDLPIRLFHWLIVLLLPASYVTIQVLNRPGLHMVLGYIVLALLLFRLAWGIVGSDTARFGRFVVSPLKGLKHLAAFGRREPDTEIGHNAAGGWMVLLLLLLLAVQVGTGLFANDTGGNEGPLAKYVGGHASDVLSFAHAVNFKLILAASALHVLAVAVYLTVKRQNLIRPMVTGKKRLPAATRAPRMASAWLALAILVATAAVAFAVATQL